MFFLSSALLLASAITFVLFAEDGIAEWAKEPQEMNKVGGEIADDVKYKKCDNNNDYTEMCLDV